MVTRIEKIDGGRVLTAEPKKETGKFKCHPFGSNVEAVEFDTLDEVADFLRAHPRAGVRMNPGWTKISEGILIDGVPLR